jgi:hypothetical protein
MTLSAKSTDSITAMVIRVSASAASPASRLIAASAQTSDAVVMPW